MGAMGKEKLPPDLAGSIDKLALSAAERAALEKALGGADHFGDRFAKLGNLAMAELVGWIVGRRRFNSVSESDTSRVLEIFLDIRNEPPTLDKLVDDLGIPESRARSMLGRMRYGEARALRQLQYRHALDRVQSDLGQTTEQNTRKQLWLDKTVADCVDEAANAIMQDTAKRGKGKPYALAEFPAFSSQRYGTAVWTTTKMWDYILDWLKAKSAEKQ